MGWMTKLVLLTMMAVSFLPQDGIEALRCYVKSPDKDDRKSVCCPPSDAAQYCATFESRISGTLKVGMRCYEANILLHGFLKTSKEGDCSKVTFGNDTVPTASYCLKDRCLFGVFAKNQTVPTKICLCNKTHCNGNTSAADRPRHHSSSILSLCVAFIFLAVSFFAKP